MIDIFVKLLNVLPKKEVIPPTNTLAHIFGKDYKENFISDWLAFLFNPEFMDNSEALKSLLELALKSEVHDVSDVKILREHTFSDNRRIDFLIETKEYIIGIENKIWSGLQENQLFDYEKQLLSLSQLKSKEAVLILLCPKANKIYSDSHLLLGEFKIISYENLVEKFKHIRLNPFKNIRANLLMEDFITHMEEYIMQGESKAIKNLEMWNFQRNHKDDINKLLNSIEASKKQFGDFINEKITAIAPNEDEWETSIHANAKDPYFQLYKSNWKKSQVHFELLKKGEFPPSDLQIVLHTREKGKTGKTEDLYRLQEVVTEYLYSKYCKDSFPISYENEKEFEESMAIIFEILETLIKKFTPEIDKGIC